MNSSFDRITNSRLFKITKTIGDVVTISALFALFCLPVVTIGASASALYYTVYRRYKKKKDNITKDFMHSLKINLKDGIIVNLIYLVYSAVVGFNIYFAINGLGSTKLPEWYTIVAFIPLLPLIFTLPFVYALMARFNNSIKSTIQNSFTLCMMNFPKFLLIWLTLIIAIAVTVCLPPAVLVTPVIATYLIQMITEKAFKAARRVEKARAEGDQDPEDEPAVENDGGTDDEASSAPDTSDATETDDQEPDLEAKREDTENA